MHDFVSFLREWESYVTLLEGQASVRGKNLTIDTRKRLSKEQKENLRRLKRATKEEQF
jgi:hypothetical protein